MKEGFNLDNFYYAMDELVRLAQRAGWNEYNIAKECEVTVITARSFMEGGYMSTEHAQVMTLFLIAIGYEVDASLTAMLVKGIFLDGGED